jgi:hypothetical protein
MTKQCVFNEEVYLSLSEENQIKVEHIYEIAHTLKVYGIDCLTPREFDMLYDKTVSLLEDLSGLFRIRAQASTYGPFALSLKRRRNQHEDDGN